jgi:hypothetical protein
MGFAAAFAIAGTAAPSKSTIRTASGTGTIKSLTGDAIVVHSVFDLSCRLTSRSPSAAGFAIGDRVRIVCVGGVLVRIRSAVSHPAANDSTPDTRPTDGSAPTTAGAVGAITTLTATSIAVTGDRSLTCYVGLASPALGDYQLGDHVKVGCVNGMLYVIARVGDAAPTASSTTTSTTTAKTGAPATGTQGTTTAGGSGTLTALGSTSVTLTGDRSLTCAVGPTSPSTTAFHVGDAVRIGCVNGVLYYIVAATPPPSSTTTTTTTATTTSSNNTYGFGTISALGAASISVTGDSALTCAVTGDSPPLGDYHVGDAVKIGCRNGVLYGIVRNAPTTTSTTTTTTTTASANTYASGTITALSATSVTVTGTSTTLTCAIAPSGPSPSVYGFKVGDHLTIACENGVLAHVSTA